MAPYQPGLLCLEAGRTGSVGEETTLWAQNQAVVALVQCLLSAQAQGSLTQNSRLSLLARLESLRIWMWCATSVMALAQKLVRFPSEASTAGVERLEKGWGKRTCIAEADRWLIGLSEASTALSLSRMRLV